MTELESEEIKIVKNFLLENNSLNLDNLSLILNKFQKRIIDLENEVFLNKNKNL